MARGRLDQSDELINAGPVKAATLLMALAGYVSAGLTTIKEVLSVWPPRE